MHFQLKYNKLNLARILFFTILIVGVLDVKTGYAQKSVSIHIIDTTNGFRQPFIKVINKTQKKESLSGINGLYVSNPGDTISLYHVLFKQKTIVVSQNDSIQVVFLEPLEMDKWDLSQDSKGGAAMKQFQDTMLVKSFKKLPYLKYETNNKIVIYTKPKDKTNISNLENWKEKLSIISIEDNLFDGPKKSLLRVIYSEIKSEDSTYIDNSKSTLIPTNLQSISPLSEYLYINNDNYYNPLYPAADKRYNFYYFDQMKIGVNSLDVVMVIPEKSRYFASVIAILYFDSNTKHLIGSSYRPAKAINPWQLNSDYVSLPKMTGLQNNVYFEIYRKKLPKYNMDARSRFLSTKDNFQFDRDSSTVKKNDIRIFQSSKDSTQHIQNEYYTVEPLQESEKLTYLKSDSAKGDYINRKWYNIIANIALENIGYKVGKGYFNNILKLNQYESIRIGIGYQSLNILSDRLKFGGYVGYGIIHKGPEDNGFRFGFNTGVYLGKEKKKFLDYNFKDDILEPGRTFYFYEEKDQIRNFFANRVGLTLSNNISFSSSINNNFVYKINFDNYTFNPQFEYYYQPTPEDSITNFRFSELGFQVRIGKFSALNPRLSRLFHQQNTFIPVLYFNYVEGFDTILKGEYAYHKFNAKLKTYYIFNEKFHLDITAETGLATKEIPYPVLYTGNGNISSIASIMIQDAFQTMDLYNYLTDKYFNLFTTFYVNFKTANKNRMRPQVGVAWNMGWGKLNGNPNVQNFPEDEAVTDYRNGYYETGILFTNFLQVKILGLIRGQFGMGAFYNVGEQSKDASPFAFRVTYKITTF